MAELSHFKGDSPAPKTEDYDWSLAPTDGAFHWSRKVIRNAFSQAINEAVTCVSGR